MVKRLFHLPGYGQGVEHRVHAEMYVATETARSDVIGRHERRQNAGRSVDAAFERFVVARGAQRLDHVRSLYGGHLPSAPYGRASDMPQR